MRIHFLFSFLDSHEIIFKRTQTYQFPVELYQNRGFSTFLLLVLFSLLLFFFFRLSLFPLSFSLMFNFRDFSKTKVLCSYQG